MGIIPPMGPHTPKMWRFAESLRQKINKRMWAWQAWQRATPPHPSVNK